MVDRWRGKIARALMGLGALAAVGCNTESVPDAHAVAVVQRMRSLMAPPSPEGTRSRPVLPPSTVERVQLAEDGLVAKWGTQAPRPGAGRTAHVALPEDARLPFHLRDATSGLSLFVTREGARPAEAQVVDGYVVYTGAHTEGADVLYRFTPEGTEDYVAFERAPASPGVTYGLRLGDGVAGLRLMANTLELLDAGGTPRLRMAPPYLVGQGGRITPADISVEGCATDTRPAAPRGRRVTEPGARYCQVHVAWRAEDVKYPAVLDSSWTATNHPLRPCALGRGVPQGRIASE